MNFKILSFVGVSVLAMVTSVGWMFNNVATSKEVLIPSTNLENKVIKLQPVPSNNSSVLRLNLLSEQVVQLKGPIFENAEFVVEELKQKAKTQKELFLLIDSPGGSVMAGAMILSAMEASPALVHTVCMGLCASMAFVIHQYGHSRLALNRAILMAHPAAGGVEGTLGQMSARLSTITRYVDKMDAHIAKRAKISFEDFKALTVSEFWIDSEDALEKHFLDKIVDINVDASGTVFIMKQQSDDNLYKHMDLVW